MRFRFIFWFIQEFGLYMILVYSGVWFIQGSGLLMGLVYTRFRFIQGFGLNRILTDNIIATERKTNDII
jgi:hypothetical protein